jgi:hypothetical protein
MKIVTYFIYCNFLIFHGALFHVGQAMESITMGVEHHNGNEHGNATCDNFANFISFQECIVA